jgi:hypothetical protein
MDGTSYHYYTDLQENFEEYTIGINRHVAGNGGCEWR